MTRPLNIEFPGAAYHVIDRGDWREDMLVDNADRQALLRFDAQALACCLMDNRYQCEPHTRLADLPLQMHHVDGSTSWPASGDMKEPGTGGGGKRQDTGRVRYRRNKRAVWSMK